MKTVLYTSACIIILSGYLIFPAIKVVWVSASEQAEVDAARGQGALTNESTVNELAQQFVEELEAYEKSIPTSTYTAETENYHQVALKNSFKAAYSEIDACEQKRKFCETLEAREIIQEAINGFMLSDGVDKSKIITQNLDAYSRFMTEVFIARS